MAEIHDLNPTDASNTARFPENQAPSTVNNGARALEGIIARYFYDSDTSVVATLSGSVIEITANRNSLTLTGTTSNYVANLMVAFTMGSNPNPSPCSLNVDGVGPISLRDGRGATLSSSVILAGQRAMAVKDGDNDYFRLLWPVSPSEPSSVLTTAGDTLYRNSTGLARLAIGTAGQVWGVNSGATAPEWADRTVLETSVATTSGTEHDFTGIPAWVREITIIFSGVSLSGSDDLFIQIGDSGGFETTGYAASSARVGTDGDVSSTTSAFIIRVQNVGGTVNGQMTLTLADASNTWISSHSAQTDTANVSFGGGKKQLSGALTQVRITRGGTNTFDAGAVNIQYR